MEKGRITTLKDVQLIQALWQNQINGEEELTPQSRFNRMMDEVREAEEEARNFNGTKGSTERFAGEVADVIFVALGVLSTLNVSVEDELNRIMDTNHRKYNPVVNHELRRSGMNHQEAMSHQKRIYTRK